jgi:hypothetical protein
MATLAYQQSKIGGTELTFAAASVGGDKVAPADRASLLVKNASAGAITVTVVTPGSTKYGQADPDVAVVVAAGATTAIGPFPQDLGGTDGLVSITYSAVTSVTVAAITV